MSTSRSKNKQTTKAHKDIPQNEGQRNKALDGALADIERAYGKGSIMRLGGEGYLPPEIKGISTGSIGLDMGLGGKGLPRGRIVEIYGPESSGKTTLTLHVIASASTKDRKSGG